MEREIKLYTLREPRRWSAGRVGEREIFFDCGICERREPEIYGYLGYGPEFQDIALRQGKEVWYLLMLCENCYKKYENEKKTRNH